MSLLTAPFDLAALIGAGPGYVIDHGDPGDGSTYVDGDSGPQQDVIMEAVFRVKTWSCAIDSQTAHYTNTNLDGNGYPNTTPPTWQDAGTTSNATQTFDLTPIPDVYTVPLPDGYTNVTPPAPGFGSTEASCLAAAFGHGIARGGLTLILLTNGNAAAGHLPFVLYFTLGGGVTVTTPAGNASASFDQGSAATWSGDGNNSFASGYPGYNQDGLDGTGALTFLQDDNGEDRAFNLSLPAGVPVAMDAQEPNPDYNPAIPTPPPPAPPGQPPNPVWQPPTLPSAQPSDYYQANVTAVRLTPKEWWEWDGTYHAADGTLAGGS